jgi:hypothetical protein
MKRTGKGGSSLGETSALRIKLRARDNLPMSMRELREALLEAALALKEYEPGYRAKFATIYLTMVDEHGTEVRINSANELTIHPYKTAADELGI